MMFAFTILGLVSLQRLAELIIANRNTMRLMSEGAKEVGESHYPVLVALHVAWLGALFLWAALVPVTIHMGWLVAYLALQAFRLWVMLSLGRFWTTRIIVPRNVGLVRRGPYRFVRHPNYIAVVLEIAILPFLIGAWPVAIVFSVLNAGILWVRITAENRSFESRVSLI